MTQVHVAIGRPGPYGRMPLVGDVTFSRSKRTSDGAWVVLPIEFSERLILGECTVDLEPTKLGECWIVGEPTTQGRKRSILVPDVSDDEVLEYSSLPDVDPATLEPSAEPEAAWWAIVESLPLPAFRPDPDDEGALIVDLWSWQLASDDPNAMLVTVEA